MTDELSDGDQFSYKPVDPLTAVRWGDDALFFTHTWRDETSQFDNHPSVRWEPGGEYYSREYKCRVPLAFQGCNELVEAFVEMMQDRYPEAEGFWVE